jgi:DNA-binding IclR family transcriptional regulator
VLNLLFAFTQAQHTLGAKDLASAAGIPLPSTHRYLALLRDLSLVVESTPGRYHLSPLVLSLGEAAESAEPLIAVADEVMQEISRETDETVLLVKIMNGAAVCIHRIESRQRLRLSYQPGHLLPLTHGASAKVLLSGMSARALEHHLANNGEKISNDFRQEIELVRQRGWAVTSEEVDRGIWAASAPVIYSDSVIAALTVPCPLLRVSPATEQQLVELVRKGAETIGALFGTHDPSWSGT